MIKNQKLSSYLLCFLGVIAILLPMFTSLKTYEDFYGKIYCQANQSQLKIYADVQGEYGMLKKTLKNVQKYEICELHQKQILFYQQNHVESYLAYPESSQMTAPEIVKPYQGIQYGNNEHSLSFVSQGIIVDGELCPFQQIDVVNDNMLKINGKSQMCYAYFSKIQYHKGVKILFPFETPSFLSAVSQSDAKQTVSQTLTSQEQMNKTSTQHSNKTDVKSYEDFLNAVKNVQSFTSNHTIVKIHTKSQDKNKIVKDVAKTLTIMNNDKNMRIDTQILKIEIIAGDDLEFVARVYDRQDCENEEKQLHNYILRIKKLTILILVLE